MAHSHARNEKHKAVSQKSEISNLMTLQEDSTEEAQEGRLKVHLTNGSTHSVDLIISATGVQPNTSWLENRLTLDPDEKGVLVNR